MIAVTILGTDGAPELWVKELPDGPIMRLTTDGAFTRRPVWSWEGRTIAYVTNAGGSYHARTIAADGSSTSAFEVLLERERQVYEVFFTPERGGLLVRKGTGASGGIGFVDLTRDSVPEAVAIYTADSTFTGEKRERLRRRSGFGRELHLRPELLRGAEGAGGELSAQRR